MGAIRYTASGDYSSSDDDFVRLIGAYPLAAHGLSHVFTFAPDARISSSAGSVAVADSVFTPFGPSDAGFSFNFRGNTVAVEIHGGELGDIITGGQAGDVLVGGGGNDLFLDASGNNDMTGGNGDDRFYVNNQTDLVHEAVGEGTDTVYARASYALGAGEEIESIRAYGVTSGVTLTGNEYNQTIIGSAFDDTLNGGAGVDRLTGRGGDDTYYIGNNTTAIIEADGGGEDTIYSTVSYTMRPFIENLFLIGPNALNANGNYAANVITGNEYDNVINALGGADTIIGGLGRDRLNGGGDGNDTFVFLSLEDSVVGARRDVITSFISGLDKIDLSAIQAVEGAATDQAFTFMAGDIFTGQAGELHVRERGGYAPVVEVDVNGDRLADFQLSVNTSVLLASDFIL